MWSYLQKTVFLAATALVAALLLPTFPTVAQIGEEQPTFKLVVGGNGSTSWNIQNIAPGNGGIETVTLQNTGTIDGTVIIWISDIISSEGLNPESETGNLAEPGELDDHLLLNVAGDRLVTNLPLPVSFNQFPTASDSDSFVHVRRLKSGETITLTWLWQLPPQTGNDIQGDSLSFSLNYMLNMVQPEDITWESYRETDFITVWGTIDNRYNHDYRTVYLYGEGFTPGHSYLVGFYDGKGNKVGSNVNGLLTDTALSTSFWLGTNTEAAKGTWHAVVFDSSQGTPPANYANTASTPGYIIEDNFEVSQDAIPEFPSLFAGIAVAGLCAFIYYRMRKNSNLKAIPVLTAKVYR